jgi:1-acyl-sn-glycerol-3-phosphate acyltransferase
MERYPETYRRSPVLVEIVRFCGLFFSKIFWRIEYHNTEFIPPGLKSGLIICSNHQTYLDPFWICFPIKRKLRFMAWDKAFNWLLIGRMIKKLGAFPVNLKGKRNLGSIRKSLYFLKKGETLVIFPEGEREFSDGKLLEFKTGFVHLAKLANVPILPVTVVGGNKVWSQNHKFPRPGKIRIYFHPVIYLSEVKTNPDQTDLAHQTIKKLKSVITSKL